MHIPLAQKIRDFAAALQLADSLIMRVPVVSEMAPARATVTMPVLTEGHSWKYAPFEYADTVTPYAARTCVLPLLLPMMREAMALYTSLETLAETASLYPPSCPPVGTARANTARVTPQRRELTNEPIGNRCPRSTPKHTGYEPHDDMPMCKEM
jgi:hypothetical protein